MCGKIMGIMFLQITGIILIVVLFVLSFFPFRHIINTIKAEKHLLNNEAIQTETQKKEYRRRFYFVLSSVLILGLEIFFIVVYFIFGFSNEWLWKIRDITFWLLSGTVIFIAFAFLIFSVLYAIARVNTNLETHRKFWLLLGVHQFPALFVLFLGFGIIGVAVSFSSGPFLRSGTYVSYYSCGEAAQTLVTKMGIKRNDIHSCTNEKHVVNGKEVNYIELSYGPGQDCPAGCIYETTYAIVSGDDWQPINQIPIIRDGRSQGNDIAQISDRYGCSSTQSINFTNSTLVQIDGKYRWLIRYENEPTKDRHGNTCVISGTELTNIDRYGKSDLDIVVNYSTINTSGCGSYDLDCHTATAAAKGEPSLCHSSLGLRRVECYEGVATRTLNEDICNYINNDPEFPLSAELCREKVKKYSVLEAAR